MSQFVALAGGISALTAIIVWAMAVADPKRKQLIWVSMTAGNQEIRVLIPRTSALIIVAKLRRTNRQSMEEPQRVAVS